MGKDIEYNEFLKETQADVVDFQMKKRDKEHTST